MSHIAVCLCMFRRSAPMANETRSSRSANHNRSGRTVILVQIVSWCAVGALLIFRGVSTLTADETLSSKDNITVSALVTASYTNDTKTSGESDENEGKLMLSVFHTWLFELYLSLSDCFLSAIAYNGWCFKSVFPKNWGFMVGFKGFYL